MNFFEQIYGKKVLLKNMTIAATTFLLMSSQLNAVNYTFTPTVVGDNWNNGANWAPAGGPPNAADTAIINANNTANVTTAGDTALIVTVGSFTSGTVNISGNGLLTSTTANLGDSAAVNTGIVNITGPIATWNNSAGNLTIGSIHNGNVNVLSAGALSASNITLGQNVIASGNLTVSGGSSSTVTNTLTVGNSNIGVFNLTTGAIASNNAAIIGNISTGNGIALVDGVGTIWISSGALTIGSAGTGNVTITNGAQASSSSTVVASAVGSTGVLNLAASGVNRGLLNTTAVTGGAGNSSFNFNGGVLQASGNNATFINNITAGQAIIGANGAFIDSQAFNITIPQALQGPGQLTKQGSGLLVLSGTNTFAGGITISAGTLQGTVNVGLPNAAASNVIDNGILIIDQAVNATYIANISGTGSLVKNLAGNLTLAPASGTNSYQGGTTINAGILTTTATGLGTGPVLDNTSLVFDQTTTSTFGGNISGPGTVTKLGTGTTILTGTNTYLGGTTITTGTLQVNSSSVGAGAILNNASLVFDQAINGTLGVNISGTGTVTKQNNGTLILTGTNSYLGGTTVTGGILQGNTTSIPASNGVLNNAILVFDQAANGTYTGNITGTGTFIKQGGATLILTGTNTYAGGTIISAGALQGSTTNIPSGPVLDNASLVFDQPVDGVFSGNISGVGTLTKLNAGTLILSGVNSYSGGTAVNAGTLQGNTFSLQGNIANNANVVFDQTFDGTYTGAMSGAGNFLKTGAGKLQLTGNSGAFTGNTTVAAGNLNVNGTLGGNTTVDLGAIISGNGFLNNLTNNGTVSPGNSIGTLHVVNFVNGPSGTYVAEISSSGASDRIEASGTATILGGQLIVIAEPGNYMRGTTFTLIQAAGGLFGQFPSTILPGNIPLSVTYLPNSLILTVLGNIIDTTGLSGNALRVARYIRDSVLDPSSDLLTVIDALDSLDPAERQSAYNQLHPALFEALALSVRDTTHLINTTFVDRLNYLRRTVCCNPCDPCACKAVGLWSAGVADFVRQSRTGELRRFNATNQGLAAGFDNQIADSIFAGIGAGYTHTNLQWGDSAGHAYIDGYYVGGYATKYCDNYYIDGTLLLYVNQHHSRRHIHFADIDRRAKNRHYSYGFNPHLGAGLYLDYCSVQVIPFFDIDYYLVQQNRVREHGADSINLHVKRNQTNLLRLETGLQFTKSFTLCCGDLIPTASVSYVGHRVLSGDKYISSFEDVVDTFSVYGTRHCFNQVELGAGVMYIVNNDLAVNLWYDAELGHKRREQEVNLEFNYRF